MNKKLASTLKYFPNILICLFIPFTLCIFAPIELYESQINYLWFSIFDFGGYLIVFFFAVFIFLIIADYVLSKLPGIVWSYCTLFLFFIMFAMYIQGNFVHFYYGVLDGSKINWTNYPFEGFVSGLSFISIPALGIILCKKLSYERIKRIVNTICVCTMLTQIVTLVIAGFSNDLFQRKYQTVCTTKDEFVYSSNDNFIIIILDSFDQKYLNDLLRSENSHLVTDTFQNFTYYPDMINLYQMTDYSIPQIVSDSRYLCSEPYDTFLQSAYSDSYLIKKLNDLNYEVGIYSTAPLPESIQGIDNWKKAEYKPTSHTELLKYLYKLVGFRYMPQQLKRYFWFYPGDTKKIREIYQAESNEANSHIPLEVYDWFNSDFYKSICNNPIETRDSAGSFRLYHLKGMHPVRNWDRSFNKTDYEVSEEETALSLMDMLNTYFISLEKAGIYDNTSIIVMADHGIVDKDNSQLGNLPIFLYKGKGAQHDFTFDETPHSYGDLNDLYADILGDAELFGGFTEKTSKQRYIYDIIWAEQSSPAGNGVAGFKKMYINSDPRNPNNYEYKGEKYMIAK